MRCARYAAALCSGWRLRTLHCLGAVTWWDVTVSAHLCLVQVLAGPIAEMEAFMNGGKTLEVRGMPRLGGGPLAQHARLARARTHGAAAQILTAP
jgi:hypothetical protein